MAKLDLIWNMTGVCPHDCATCCVDAVHVKREGEAVLVRSEGLAVTDRLARPKDRSSIYGLAAKHMQAKGLELDFAGKRRLLGNIDIPNTRLDISGGDPLCVPENLEVLRSACVILGRHNVTLTATGAGLAGLSIPEVAGLIGEYNFTFDSASVADVAHRPKQYAARNFKIAQEFTALGAVTRAEFPITRSTSDPDHLHRLYVMLHEAGVDKLLLMRLFPVGRGGGIAADTLTPDGYRAAIATLRALEKELKTPVLKLQCALRHFEAPTAGGLTRAMNPCDMVQESFGVTPDGTLLMSPWAINGRGRPMDALFVLGNLAEQKLSEILASDKVAEVRRRANENHGHCKIFTFLNSTLADPMDRLFDAADPLYVAPVPASASLKGDAMSLETIFAGLRLKSPIIAASAPPTESAAAIQACADAGVGAIVTKSIADYDRADFPAIPRRAHHDRPRRAYTISGSFQSETLTLSEGVRLVSEARDQTDTPVIASVGVLDPASPAAVEAAMRLVAAGAQMIHFDLFYLPRPRCSDASLEALKRLFTLARAELGAPFGAKFNLDIPADAVVSRFAPQDADAWFALDSIRTPPPLTADGHIRLPNLSGALEGSRFGAWQKPISLQYGRQLADAGFPDLCVGGGLASADDILEAVMLGATTVQAATPIIVHGYDWIRRMNDQLADQLDTQGTTLADLRGHALRVRDAAGGEAAQPVRARVEAATCTNCGVCTKLVFCPFIKPGQPVPTIEADCYGCGLCEALCPVPGAILMEAA